MNWLLPFMVLGGLTGALVGGAFLIAYLSLRGRQHVIKSNPGEKGLVYESVSFPSLDNTPLQGWFIPSTSHPESEQTLVLSHGFDSDRTFILIEIAGDEMYFQTLSRSGNQVDAGVLRRPVRTPAPATK